MANQLQFELASPQKLACSKPVVMVTVPGGEGDFGVMLGHAPMATTVAMGVVEAYEHDQTTVTERWFVAGGFCEVVGDRCTVMADQVIAIKDLKKDILEEEIASLAKEAANDSDAAQKMAIAQAKLQVIG
ncbi:MAG: ATP synthase F1 subunit epsilon [Bdellovibrionales bacterium]|jgi:F-type H+-transporting ATPase subunit epsilon